MTIHHIVLVKFKEGITGEGIQDWKSAASKLPLEIPEIKELIIGNKIPHQFDNGWDEGMIMKFENAEDLHIYVAHKAHKDFQSYASQYAIGKLIFDIEI